MSALACAVSQRDPNNVCLLLVNPQVAAEEARLRYVSDLAPGIRRVRAGKGFRYVLPDGSAVRDPAVLQRVRSLVLPPAWNDVWICMRADGHLQATGRDARGRKQYRYHDRWRSVRDEAKFERLKDFAKVLPDIRARVQSDLSRPGLPREKVLATVVRLLETTLIRVGNEEYARSNGSFGLTTLRNRHVVIEGTTLRFRFRGKSKILHMVEVSDRRLARIVERCQDLPGQELFQFEAEPGAFHPVDSSDVNDYLKTIAGQPFTAKDFRTWAGTNLAARFLQQMGCAESKTQAKRNVVRALSEVARCLGNTRAICRKCYVHPVLIEAYLHGEFFLEPQAALPLEVSGLSSEENAVLRFLEKAPNGNGMRG